ncbi:MAG TPA: RNA polymerase sigma factor [Gemmatimonadales bacterium]|nr:RNA polymerase sigma factor [Gemmatimonadales bacterium]
MDRFDRLVAEHGAALRRLARGYAGEANQEDLLQEILFALWRALPSFRGECSERTFVFRVGHNRGLTYRARLPRHYPLEAAGALPDPRADAERETARAMEAERLMQGIQRLPDTQRAVVMLFLEGLSHREIADVLGATENTVALRLSRARKALRVILGERTQGAET